MADVRITVKRITVHRDLMELYENPIEHACDMKEGMEFVSHDGKRPEGFCDSAWDSVRPFVEPLSRGEGNFYDGWMKDPMSAMISCNDGFRPVSFYLELIRRSCFVLWAQASRFRIRSSIFPRSWRHRPRKPIAGPRRPRPPEGTAWARASWCSC